MKTYIALFSLALTVSFTLTPVIRNFAIRRGLVDEPDERRIHLTPMPRIGGVAIFISFVVSAALICLLTTAVTTSFKADAARWLSLVGPACLIFAVGLYDDI